MLYVILSEKQCLHSAVFACPCLYTGRVLLRALPLELQAPGGGLGCVGVTAWGWESEQSRWGARQGWSGWIRGWCRHGGFSLRGLPAHPLGSSPWCV